MVIIIKSTWKGRWWEHETNITKIEFHGQKQGRKYKKQNLNVTRGEKMRSEEWATPTGNSSSRIQYPISELRKRGWDRVFRVSWNLLPRTSHPSYTMHYITSHIKDRKTIQHVLHEWVEKHTNTYLWTGPWSREIETIRRSIDLGWGQHVMIADMWLDSGQGFLSLSVLRHSTT